MLLTATILSFAAAPHPRVLMIQQASAAAEASEAQPAIADAPLEAYRVQLLDLAYEIASSLPAMPHVKDRSREQEATALACLELDQPVRALRQVESILNWRRGAGYADYAFYCAEKGATDEADRHLEKAVEIALWPEQEIKQAWRRDRIRAKVARTYVALGRKAEAASFTVGLADSEWGQVDALLGAALPADEFAAWFQGIEGVLEFGSFDQVVNALNSLAQMHGRFYADDERRARIEAAIQGGWTKAPRQVRFEVALLLGENAVSHGDAENARVIAAEARRDLALAPLDPRTRIPLAARLAELSFLSGNAVQGRAEADAALATFQEERERIVDIFRAETLIPLAEAYVAMGVRETALAVYELAIAEGIENPNSRPRAEDLGAVCRSMALLGVEPSKAAWDVLREIAPTLGREYENL